MPDIAGSWPEEGTQYVPGDPVQQPYQPQQYAQQQQYQQQQYPQQGYPDQQQYSQQEYQQQQQYPQQMQQQQPYQDQTMPQQAVYAEEEQAAVPSEFDHLFRDSSPENRKSISARQPVVSGPGVAASPGFQQQQQQAGPAQSTALYAPAQQPAPGYEDQRPDEYGGQQQPFGNGGYVGGNGGYGGGGSGRSRTPLIIGGVVVVVAAVGLYLGLSGGGGSSAKSPHAGASTSATHASNESAQQQAAAVYQLVQQSKQLRSDINAEVGSLDSCSNVSSLQSEITSTAQSRQAQADQVSKLDVSKINGGAALVSALNAAWTDSATSDSNFAKAAGDVSGSCSKSAVRNDPNYQAAGQGSSKATNDKSTAVGLWNQTMTNYGQPQISSSDL